VRSKSGFTLIELLVAMGVLLLLLAFSMFGYQLFSQQWRKENHDISNAYNLYRSYDLFSNSMHGVIPYLVTDRKNRGFYFLGRIDGFTAVTQTPMLSPGAPAVIRIFSEKTAAGLYKLVYEEASLKTLPLIELEQTLPFGQRVILFEGLKKLSFQYYRAVLGAPELNDQGDVIKKYEWVTAHDGFITKAHPVKIEIDIDGFNWRFIVPDRSGILKSRFRDTFDVD
jgi:prepilin-type N-terminal cleavage/methylation domain-containing protein